MNLGRLSLDPVWMNQKLDLIQQHNIERRLYFTVEDETWYNLEQKHFQQRRKLDTHLLDLLKIRQLIQQQFLEVQEWRATAKGYRQALQAYHNEETLRLDNKKNALLA